RVVGRREEESLGRVAQQIPFGVGEVRQPERRDQVPVGLVARIGHESRPGAQWWWHWSRVATLLPRGARSPNRFSLGPALFGPATRGLDHVTRLGGAAVTAGRGLLLLEILVDLEEVLDLAAMLRVEVADVVHVPPGRVMRGGADDLLVRPLLVRHVED